MGCFSENKSVVPKDLLYIDQNILKGIKPRQKHKTMAWIDFKKTSDIVPRSWIVKEISKVGDHSREWPKGSFSIATTPRWSGGCYSIPRIVLLYAWSSPYSAEYLAKRNQVPFFESLVWFHLGLNPGLPDHWRTLYSLDQWPPWL